MSMHLSSLTIDALAGGHLGDDEAARARSHIETCGRCRTDLEATEAACAHFTRSVLPRTVDKLRPRPWWRTLAPLLVPVVAVAVLLVWFVRKPGDSAVGPGDDIRIKGAVTLQVFAKRGESVIPLRDGTRLAAGDAIRFVVAAERARYVLVASVDGAGKATVYYPSSEIAATPRELPGSIVLDDAPGPERVFAIYTAAPIEASVVTRALTALGARGPKAIRDAHTVPVEAVAQATVMFEKETR